jgi:two-component system response regulator DevR
MSACDEARVASHRIAAVTLRVIPHVERRARLILVADHDVLRLGLRAVLEASRRLDVVADVATVAEASMAAAAHHPDLVVIVAPLADETWIGVCREVLASARDTRVVILGECLDEASAREAARAGAVGWVSRRIGAPQLCRTLADLAAGERTSFTSLASPPRPRGGAMRDVLALTAQERRVLELVADGKTNKEIGTALGLSAKTVKNYLSHAFEKLNVSRRAQAAVLFIKDHGSAFMNGRSV